MKKLILISSCVVLFAGASFAQTDTTRTKTDPTKSTEQTPQSTDQLRQRDQQDMKGWTRVETTTIPDNLRTTLSGNQYQGWESGTIYRNEAGDMYSLRTTGNNPKTYYFDKNGKATKKPNN